jgi:hypothetical protein
MMFSKTFKAIMIEFQKEVLEEEKKHYCNLEN